MGLHEIVAVVVMVVAGTASVVVVILLGDAELWTSLWLW